jgi:Cytochrome P460
VERERADGFYTAAKEATVKAKPHMKRIIFILLVTFVVMVGWLVGIPSTSTLGQSSSVLRAQFNSRGEVLLPVGYRQWVHVGTRDNPAGKVNILDGKRTVTPEVLEAYVEPEAFAVYQKTSKWPEGSQLVKEFSAIRIGAGCKPETLLCTTEFGDGVYQSGYIGLGMMVKDAERFPSAPGHWGFFAFGHKPPPYDPISAVRPASQCAGCHVTLASDTDFVISRAHIGLARAKEQ